MLKRTGAILVLLAMYIVASAIGETFGDALKVFSVLVWMLAIGMFAYAILFRGMKLDPSKIFTWGEDKQSHRRAANDEVEDFEGSQGD